MTAEVWSAAEREAGLGNKEWSKRVSNTKDSKKRGDKIFAMAWRLS